MRDYNFQPWLILLSPDLALYLGLTARSLGISIPDLLEILTPADLLKFIQEKSVADSPTMQSIAITIGNDPRKDSKLGDFIS